MRNANQTNDRDKTAGFSLMELMVAASLAGIVLSAFVAGFLQQRMVFNRKGIEQELQQNVRHAMRAVQQDLHAAGGGLVMGTKVLDDWFWSMDLSAVTDIPHIVDGGGGADELITAGYSGEPVARLNGGVSTGATRLRIDILDTSLHDYAPRVGDVLVVGGVEAARIESLANYSDKKIDIQTDPFQSNSGLELDYPDGVDIHLLHVVRYRIQSAGGVPGLTREDSRYDYASEEDKRIAENITDLRVARNGEMVQVSITGASPGNVYGAGGDGPETYTLASSVLIANPDPQLVITAWPVDAMMTPTPTP